MDVDVVGALEKEETPFDLTCSILCLFWWFNACLCEVLHGLFPLNQIIYGLRWGAHTGWLLEQRHRKPRMRCENKGMSRGQPERGGHESGADHQHGWRSAIGKGKRCGGCAWVKSQLDDQDPGVTRCRAVANPGQATCGPLTWVVQWLGYR